MIFPVDIARLVLDYLQDQGLHDVALHFCKSSPYLKLDDFLLRQRMLPYRNSLEEFLREYGIISIFVNEYLSTVPEKEIELRHCSLSDQVHEIIWANTKEADSQMSSFPPPESSVWRGKLSKRKSISSSESQTSTKMRRCDSEQAVNGTSLETDMSRLDKPESESAHRYEFSNNERITGPYSEMWQILLDSFVLETKIVKNFDQTLGAGEHDAIIEEVVGAPDAQTNAGNAPFEDPNSRQFPTTTEISASNIPISASAPLEFLPASRTVVPPGTRLVIRKLIATATALADPNATTTQVLSHIPALKELLCEYAKIVQFSYQHRHSCSTVALKELKREYFKILQSVDRCLLTAIKKDIKLRHCLDKINAISDPNAATTLVQSQIGSSNSVGKSRSPDCSQIIPNLNESAQKESQGEPLAISIGNSTEDHRLSQLANGTEGSVPSTNNEQVLLDMSSGPLTFPPLITPDGLMAPIASSINNNTAQIKTQADNSQYIAPTIVMPAMTGAKPNNAPIIHSCSVPPLFADEQSSIQTRRRAPVRRCNLQLSKSSNEEETQRETVKLVSTVTRSMAAKKETQQPTDPTSTWKISQRPRKCVVRVQRMRQSKVD